LNDDAVLQLVDNTTKEQDATDNASIAHEDNAPPVLQARTFLELTQDNSEEFNDESIGISVSGGNVDEKDVAVNNDYRRFCHQWSQTANSG
jgi:hypothetical protein